MGLDAKTPPPRTERELQTWYQKEILEDEDYEKKGEFMRQSSWYSILKLVRKNEGKWHCKKYHAQKVAEQLVKSPEGKKIVAETASVIKQIDAHRSREREETPAMSTQQFKAQMRKLCKVACNLLLLAPKFFHTENLINARIMWLCVCVSSTEHAYWGERKTTGEADRDLTVKYAIGVGEEMLRQMWWKAIGSADELARIGIPVYPGQVCLDAEGIDSKARLMSFLFCLTEARFWSYASKQWTLPEGFASFLAPAAKEAHDFWHDFFEAAWMVESEACLGSDKEAASNLLQDTGLF